MERKFQPGAALMLAQELGVAASSTSQKGLAVLQIFVSGILHIHHEVPVISRWMEQPLSAVCWLPWQRERRNVNLAVSLTSSPCIRYSSSLGGLTQSEMPF